MSFLQIGQLKYYVFNSFQKLGVPHGIFTRLGGCSPEPWYSLNVATSVGDSRENVIENRSRIMAIFNKSFDSVFDAWQIHSTKVLCSERPRLINEPHKKGDAVITSNQNVSLMMVFADCVPIFLYDTKKKVIGIAHAGWQGTVTRIAREAVIAMHSNYGCLPKNILAGIGPSIGPDHYEVGINIVDEVMAAFPHMYKSIIYKQNCKFYFNLWNANKIILQESGVKNIEISGVCTACNVKEWYSHRAENGKTGRFAAVLSLPL